MRRGQWRAVVFGINPSGHVRDFSTIGWGGCYLIACALLFTGCGGGDESQAHGAGGGKPGNGKPAQPPIPVAVQSAKAGPISSYYAATATLSAEKQAEILARVSGVIGRLAVEEGDHVTAGQVLLEIDNAEYQYRLDQAEANAADLAAKVERLEKMRSQDLVSPEEFETLKSNLKASQAEAGLARTNLSYTRVTAPFTGRIVTRHIDLGANVNTGTPLFVLADFNPLLARVHVPAKEFNKLKQDQAVDLVLESNGERMRGRIKLISPTIDPASGTIKVTIEVHDYPTGTRPGDFAQVSIVTERREQRTLVPKIALVSDREERVVYVYQDSTAARRVVEVGFEDDSNAEILAGVEVGERVVTKGQRSLKDGSPIKVVGDSTVAGGQTTAQTAQDGS